MSHSPWGECDISAGQLARTFSLNVNTTRPDFSPPLTLQVATLCLHSLLLSSREIHSCATPGELPVRPYQACIPRFPILGVFRLNGQPKRDDGMIFGSCKASQSPVYPIKWSTRVASIAALSTSAAFASSKVMSAAMKAAGSMVWA